MKIKYLVCTICLYCSSKARFTSEQFQKLNPSSHLQSLFDKIISCERAAQARIGKNDRRRPVHSGHGLKIVAFHIKYHVKDDQQRYLVCEREIRDLLTSPRSRQQMVTGRKYESELQIPYILQFMLPR